MRCQYAQCGKPIYTATKSMVRIVSCSVRSAGLIVSPGAFVVQLE